MFGKNKGAWTVVVSQRFKSANCLVSKIWGHNYSSRALVFYIGWRGFNLMQ